ncbi:hypothetical protein ACFQXA_10390 [Nocardiopsis composta]
MDPGRYAALRLDPAGTRHRAAQFSVHAVPAVSDRTVAVQVTPLLGLLLDRLDEGGLAAGSGRGRRRWCWTSSPPPSAS